MAIVATFTVSAEDVPTWPRFDAAEDAAVELERVVPTDAGLVPYLWVGSTDPAEFEAGFRNHPEVERVELVDQIEGKSLFRVNWKPEAEGVLQVMAQTRLTLLSAVGSGDAMAFEVRADDTGSIREFQRRCRELDIPIDLIRVLPGWTVETETLFGLTEPQREALVFAFERGYYESPRETTLAELAGELGITGKSLGSRLRRGTRRLIANTLVTLGTAN